MLEPIETKEFDDLNDFCDFMRSHDFEFESVDAFENRDYEFTLKLKDKYVKGLGDDRDDGIP